MPRSNRWPLERVLFGLAGTFTGVSALLAAKISKRFLLLTAFVGVNQWLYVLVGACPASLILRRACHLRSAIYPGASTATESYRDTGAPIPTPEAVGIR